MKDRGHNNEITSDVDAYNCYQELKPQERRGIWVTVADSLGISKKQAHDYFHNTWVKKFYDSIVAYRDQIIENLRVQAENLSLNPREIVQNTIEWFKHQHQQMRIHLQSAYSFAYNLLNRNVLADRPQPPKVEHDILDDLVAVFQSLSGGA